MSKAIDVTEATFASVVEQAGVALVDFWAVWCGPCKMVAPIVDKVSLEYEGRVRVAKVNVDENQGLATRFGIRSIPTLLIFRDGEIVDTIVGAVPYQKLVQQLDAALAG